MVNAIKKTSSQFSFLVIPPLRKNVVKVITKLHRPQIGTNKTTLQPKKKIAATQIRR